MRIKATIFCLLMSGLVYLLVSSGCSEESPSTNVDQAAPTVSIINPIAATVYGATIVDTVTVLVRAEDNVAIDKVEVYAIFHADTLARKLGEATRVGNSDDYALHWATANFGNGSSGVLYVVAFDRAGNSTASGKTPIRIINTSEIGPPTADFTVIPGDGTVDTQFTFDASVTHDALNQPIDILVRWDFEGDGVWDIDTTRNVKADEKVLHIYAVPDTYHVVLEAFNNYYSLETGIPGRITKELVVKPATGYPHPLPEQQFVQIPAGIYPFGALACPPGQQCGSTDSDETLDDTLMVRITNPYYIDKYEVTNALYLTYLNTAFRADTLITYDRDTREVRSQVDGRVLVVLDPAVTRLKYQLADSTFWADDRYLKHPATGVTWYGAVAYAAFYGLRLPTEAEWEVAARSGYIAPGPIFPWDPPGTIDASHANYRYSGDPYELGTVTGQTNPVDGYNGLGMEGFPTADAVSSFGTYGQAGNVAEWTKDWYSDLTYTELYRSYSASGSPPLDPQGPSKDSGATQKVLRGGSFVSWPWELRVTNRTAIEPFERADWIGFRTVYIDF